MIFNVDQKLLSLCDQLAYELWDRLSISRIQFHRFIVVFLWGYIAVNFNMYLIFFMSVYLGLDFYLREVENRALSHDNLNAYYRMRRNSFAEIFFRLLLWIFLASIPIMHLAASVDWFTVVKEMVLYVIWLVLVYTEFAVYPQKKRIKEKKVWTWFNFSPSPA